MRGLLQRVEAIDGGIDRQPGALQHHERDFATDLVVFGQQDARSTMARAQPGLAGRRVVGQPGRRCTGRHRRHEAATQPGREPEMAAASGCAVGARLATHQLRQPAADRQPQAGAAVLAGGRRIGLLEHLEQPRQRLGSDAGAGVFDREAHQQLLAALLQQPGAQRHRAVLGELDGVAGVIQQRLPQPRRVAAQARRHVGHVDLHAQALLGGRRRDQRAHLLEQPGQLEIGGLELDPPGLDLGQVEHVVDDRQQVLARIVDHVQAVHLQRRCTVAPQQVVQTDDGVHRGADFMAHVGQEAALGAVRGLGLQLRLGELCGALLHHLFEVVAVPFEFLREPVLVGLDEFAIGHVDGQRQPRLRIVELDRMAADLDPQQTAVVAPVRPDARLAEPFAFPTQLRQQPWCLGRRPDVQQGQAQEFLAAVAVARNRRLVDRQKGQRLFVVDPHCLRIAVEQFTVAHLAGAQRHLGDLAPRDVVKRATQLRHLAVFRHDDGLRAHPDRPALGGAQRQLQVPGRAVFHRRFQRSLDLRQRFGRVEVDRFVEPRRHERIDFVDAAGLARPQRLHGAQIEFPSTHLRHLADQLEQFAASDRFLRLPVCHAAAWDGADGQDGIAGRRHRRKAIFTGAQTLLGQLAERDVLVRADHAQCSAIGGAGRHRARLAYPDHPAVAVAGPNLDRADRRGCDLDQRFGPLQQTRPVFGQHLRMPPLDRRGLAQRFEAQHGMPTLIGRQAAGLQVPVPQRQIARLQRQPKPQLAVAGRRAVRHARDHVGIEMPRAGGIRRRVGAGHRDEFRWTAQCVDADMIFIVTPSTQALPRENVTGRASETSIRLAGAQALCSMHAAAGPPPPGRGGSA